MAEMNPRESVLEKALREIRDQALANWQEPANTMRRDRETPEYWRGYQAANEHIAITVKEALQQAAKAEEDKIRKSQVAPEAKRQDGVTGGESAAQPAPDEELERMAEDWCIANDKGGMLGAPEPTDAFKAGYRARMAKERKRALVQAAFPTKHLLNQPAPAPDEEPEDILDQATLAVGKRLWADPKPAVDAEGEAQSAFEKWTHREAWKPGTNHYDSFFAGYRAQSPRIKRLEERVERLREALAEVGNQKSDLPFIFTARQALADDAGGGT